MYISSWAAIKLDVDWASEALKFNESNCHNTSHNPSHRNEYFAEPADPNELKKLLKHKKKSNSRTSVTSGSKSDSDNTRGKAKNSDSNTPASSTHSLLLPSKASDTDTFNMISRLLNDQTERLESQINDSKEAVLSTIEIKMDNILKESERRITAKLLDFEDRIEEKFAAVGARIQILETTEFNPEGINVKFTEFTRIINNQMDELTNRMDTNLKLIRENSERINSIPRSNGTCPNEGRMTRCEGNIDNVGQENKNFSLILTGL